ncbi:MAG: hypothetical protein JO320_07115 [Alphaproteobacteria bacterium]|nr:hypothetical protein [Alphaproteobacteria bacterium]MBV9374809.1 hypothetical protein [Alphaproteobacteria bacterium]
MKHLLTGVAMVAALAFSGPVWAQPASPSGGNAVGAPGPNPGGPGLTPYNAGAPPAAPTGRGLGPKTSGGNYIPPSAPPAAMAPSAGAAMSDTTSAMPPHHRHMRHAAHGKPSHHPSRFPNLQGNVANQLNQAELQRLQAGNFSMPPGPPPPGMAPPPPPSAAATRGPGVAPYNR